MNIKRDFHKQMVELQEEQDRRVGKRLTISGSKSTSRLFDYTLKQKESIVQPHTVQQPAITEEDHKLLKYASNERFFSKYLKVDEQANCRFAPLINRKSVVLDQRHKENLLRILVPGRRGEEEVGDEDGLMESANLSKKLNSTPLLGHARHKTSPKHKTAPVLPQLFQIRNYQTGSR